MGSPVLGGRASSTPGWSRPLSSCGCLRRRSGPLAPVPRRHRLRRRRFSGPPAGDGRAADTVLRLKPPGSSSGIPVAVLGAGDYTRTEIIPALRRANLPLYSVANREPHIAAMVGREYGFALATTDSERAIAELPSPGLVVVATAHDSHAHLACTALKAGHRVFVEKPPAVTPEDVHRLAAGMRSHPGAVEIGFNRRYHPLVRRARARLRAGIRPHINLMHGQGTGLRA